MDKEHILNEIRRLAAENGGSSPGKQRFQSETSISEYEFDRKASVSNNTAQGKRIDRILARNHQNALTVAHHDVFSLTHNPESGLLKRTNRVKVIDTGDFWQD